MTIPQRTGSTLSLSRQRLQASRRLLKARSGQATGDIDLYIIHGQFWDEERQAWAAYFDLNVEVADSKGCVRLTAADPEATLAIDHAYLAEPADLERCCDGLELVRQLVTSRPLADTIRPMPGRVPAWHDREELRAWIRRHVRTTFHPSSTCRMGPADDLDAVVDGAGRVYGVMGLRVADASIFPTSPRANIHWTVVAVAEKLADVIRHDRTP